MAERLDHAASVARCAARNKRQPHRAARYRSICKTHPDCMKRGSVSPLFATEPLFEKPAAKTRLGPLREFEARHTVSRL
jgi:hypothetical protein